MDLISKAYNGINDLQKTEQVFKIMDSKNIGYLSPEQFFDACDTIYWMKSFTIAMVSNKMLLKIAYFIQHTLCIQRIVKSTIFNALMMLCVIINMVTIILSYLELSESLQEDINTIDDVLLYTYTGEAVIKIIGLGPLNYF